MVALKKSLNRLFVDSARKLLTSGQGPAPIAKVQIPVEEQLQAVMLLLRPIVADGDVFIPPMNAALHFPTTGGILGSGVALTPSQTIWSDMLIGEYRLVGTGSVAGNAIASLPSVASAFGTSASLFEVLEMLHTVDCDATAASRVPTLTVITGLPVGFVTALTDWSQVGPTLTTTENGKMFIPRGPAVVKLNDNGVFSDGATSPLPLLCDGDALTLSVTVAAGVAGDVHALSALIHRIA